MSQPLHYHHPQPQYVHYAGPPGTAIPPQIINQNPGIAPHDTTHQALQQPQSGSSTTLVATGDWTKDLVHLAKTAELKKHALTLQLHTAHILSAHASLQEKSRVIQDIREQRNKLDSERTKLLNALREINEDRDKADLAESTIEKECNEIRTKMNILTEGDYTVAKNDVDRLRQELGQAPLPSLQSILDEKTSQYLNERRLSGNESQQNANNNNNSSATASTSGLGLKRSSIEAAGSPDAPTSKRPRGRPKGSKNRAKDGGASAVASSSGSAL